MKSFGAARASIVAVLAASLWVGGWGVDRSVARSRADDSPYSSTPHPISPPHSIPPHPGVGKARGVALVAACEEELQRRLPPGPPVQVAGDYQVKSLGDEIRILGRFEGRGSATPFACDLHATEASWEVTAITIVSF